MNQENQQPKLWDRIVDTLKLLFLGGLLLVAVLKGGNLVGNSPGSVRATYTAFASSTPSSVYTDTQAVIFASGLENLHLDGRYTPSSQDSVVYILIEGSNDDGVTYYPLSTKTIGSTQIQLFSEGASSTVGNPYLFPGDSTSVSGTMYAFMEDIDIVADHVRISVKESTTSTYGVLSLDATVTTKD